MKLGTTTTEIIAIGSQFIIFHVYDTLIYKVSDKLSDFKRGELYDMLRWLQSRKRAVQGALATKNNCGIHQRKHLHVESYRKKGA